MATITKITLHRTRRYDLGRFHPALKYERHEEGGIIEIELTAEDQEHIAEIVAAAQADLNEFVRDNAREAITPIIETAKAGTVSSLDLEAAVKTLLATQPQDQPLSEIDVDTLAHAIAFEAATKTATR